MRKIPYGKYLIEDLVLIKIIENSSNIPIKP